MEESAALYPILVGGDQLTATRAQTTCGWHHLKSREGLDGHFTGHICFQIVNEDQDPDMALDTDEQDPDLESTDLTAAVIVMYIIGVGLVFTIGIDVHIRA